MTKLRAMFEAGERLSAHDIEARLFIDIRNAREYLKILHGEEGVIRVCDHRRDTPHGPATPIYVKKLSPDENDEKSPARMTPAELRRRVRSDPERWEAELRKARIARARKRFLKDGVKVDALTAALVPEARA